MSTVNLSMKLDSIYFNLIKDKKKLYETRVLDDKRKKIDGKGDIPDIISKFRNRNKEEFKDRSAKCFFVPYEEIKENDYRLSVLKYKDIKYEVIDYEEPHIIKKKIIDFENKILKSLNELDI